MTKTYHKTHAYTVHYTHFELLHVIMCELDASQFVRRARRVRAYVGREAASL